MERAQVPARAPPSATEAEVGAAMGARRPSSTEGPTVDQPGRVVATTCRVEAAAKGVPETAPRSATASDAPEVEAMRPSRQIIAATVAASATAPVGGPVTRVSAEHPKKTRPVDIRTESPSTVSPSRRVAAPSSLGRPPIPTVTKAGAPITATAPIP